MESITGLSKEENFFLFSFQNKWSNFLSFLPKKYQHSPQVNSGNRLRPLLCYWGYTVGNNTLKNSNILFDVSVALEAIHKASVIIDDIIDEDEKRTGKNTFHCDFSKYEGILVGISIIFQGLKTLKKHSQQKIHESLFIETVLEMCLGTLYELNLNPNNLSVDYIKNIMNMQTSTIIKNSFIMGSLLTSTPAVDQLNIFEEIGIKLGFLFQVMNDFESFNNPKHIIGYKGNLNIDVNRARKNICIAYLYEMSSKKDKIKLVEFINQFQTSLVKDLYDKYNIDRIIIEEINACKSSLFSSIDKLKENCLSNETFDAFENFIKFVFKKCDQKVGLG